MIQRFNETGASQIMVTPVPQENVSSYGVADCGGIELNGGESAKLIVLLKNLLLKTHHQILLWLGVMFFSSNLGFVRKTPIGVGDEIQLTDAIDMLIEKETVEAFHMTGETFDCGDKIGYMEAFVEYGIRHEKIR